MDEVFKAINDPSRRKLLDALFEEDGRSLGNLCRQLPNMTRYGVMSHLKVLEEAGLVSTIRRGRSKFHYLNPVPIRQIHDRWISKYAEPRVGAIVEMKARVEKGRRPMERPAHVYKAYIRATLDDVWDAIVDGDKTVQYFYGTRVESEWQVGGSMNYYYSNGGPASEGTILAIDPPHRIEFTFQAMWDPKLIEEGATREVWALRDVNGMVELTIELWDIAVGGPTHTDFVEGLPYIVSGLKSLVETGTALPAPY